MELWREFAVARARHRDQMDRDKTLAWHIAVLVWQKKLPSLQELLSPVPKTGRQTPAEQHAMMVHLSDQYGIPLRRRPRSS